MANAGSGKTTHLTKRVVRLLLLGVPAERIVCITYTKAAASEMRARVLLMLRDLFIADDASRHKKLQELLGEEAAQTHMDRAKQLFSVLLDSPSGGVQFATIHGFCQSMLRRFPLEAGIVPHFTVLEDAAADELLRQAKHALLRDALKKPLLAEALALLGARGGESRFDSLTADIVKKKNLWKNIWHLQSNESLRDHLWRLHGLDVHTTQAALKKAFIAALQPEDEALLRLHLPELLVHKTATYREFAEKLSAWLALHNAAREEHIDTFLEIFLTQKYTPRQKMVDMKQHPEGSPLQVVIGNWAVLAQHTHAQSAALACAEETFAVAVLARALDDYYSVAKEAAQALDYDDLIARTLALVTKPEMMGWVMSKLDHRIDHLLIDEAQDNSVAQWTLANVLVDELMATNEGAGSAGLARSLLVVGDEKQSIYSFQGAAPEEFSRYHVIFKALLENTASPLMDETLANSYRSTAPVLEVVDAVCAQPAMTTALSAGDGIIKHVLTRGNVAGCVMLYPPLLAPEKQALQPLQIPKDYSINESATQLLANSIADTIARWLKEKRILLSENRPIDAGDILIVVRKRTRVVQALIRALERRHVPVAGMDRLTLSDHLAVKDLLALMRWCTNAGDDLALAQVLRSPLVGMSDDALRAVAHERLGTLWQAISNPWLAQMQALNALSPYDFLTQVLEVSNRRHDFARRFGEEIHEILDELKAQAASMPATMPQTLAQFYDWVSGSNRQIKRESEASAQRVLRIMTVHGAKGLEAPIVILADTVDVPHTGRETVFPILSAAQQPLAALSISAISKYAPCLITAKEAKKDAILAEYYRLLYVALTRARDELHIFGTASKKGDIKDDSWYFVISAAMHACGAATDANNVRVVVNTPVASALMVSEKSDCTDVPAIPAWAHSHPAPEITATMSFLPSHVQGAQNPSHLAKVADARSRGVRIHRVLELLQQQTDASNIAQLVQYVAPDWDAKTQAALVEKVMMLRANEPWLWSHKGMAEVQLTGSITHACDVALFNGQIDRLIETPEEIIILDYKTAANVPVLADDVPLNYILQMKRYLAVVAQIYPAMPVRCAIVWTHEPSVMWLDAVVARTPFPEKNVMLTKGIAA